MHVGPEAVDEEDEAPPIITMERKRLPPRVIELRKMRDGTYDLSIRMFGLRLKRSKDCSYYKLASLNEKIDHVVFCDAVKRKLVMRLEVGAEVPDTQTPCLMEKVNRERHLMGKPFIT